MLGSLDSVIIGVIADTHVPDRRDTLDLRVLQIFEDANVTGILHAGDISTPAVLRQLTQIAPVYAVRGNRDWIALRHLPAYSELTFGSVRVGLTHGHGGIWEYIRDRIDYMARGYRLELFQSRLLDTFPEADVIVFGHTHRPLNMRTHGKLLFNPGSPHIPDRKYIAPSVGLLIITTAGDVVGEVIELAHP